MPMVVTTQVVVVESNEEALKLALEIRQNGFRSEIVNDNSITDYVKNTLGAMQNLVVWAAETNTKMERS